MNSLVRLLLDARVAIWATAFVALIVAGCGGDERTVETIPIPDRVDTCLDDLQAPGQQQSLFGTDADNIQLCVVLQGLDCVLIEELCTEDDGCSAPMWSCADPGLELEEGDVMQAALFIVEGTDEAMACADVTVGPTPACAGAGCLARIDYRIVYTAADRDPLRVSEESVQITHSGYLSEQVGVFDDEPASICPAITAFTCEGDGCGAPIRLDVSLAGTSTAGRVQIASEARDFECTDRCTFFLPSGRSTTLTATAAAGSIFGDWGEGCAQAGRSTSCELQPQGEVRVTARFGYRLDIDILGQGTVRSRDSGVDGDGIECVSDPAGTSCAEDYVTDRRVILVAEGSSEWPFTRWTGCDTVDGPSCTVAIDRARQVRAVFGRQVSIEVVGGGSVTVMPSGDVCDDRCAYAFAPGGQVSLQANATAGSTRFDWQGDCAAVLTDVCDLGALDRNISATARFGYEVTTIFDRQQGTVSREAGEPGVACSGGSADCTAYLPGTSVTFTASPAADPAHAFIGWQGLCANAASNLSCMLNIGTAGTVGATFDRAVRLAIQVVNDGQANGSVVTEPTPNASGCSVPDCGERWLQSTQSVDLVAMSPGGTRFLGWSAADGNRVCLQTQNDFDPMCTVDLSAGVDRVIEARFVSEQQVTVNLVGEGTGMVMAVADPPSPNWSCVGSRCTGDFAFGQTVALTTQTPARNHFELFRSSESGCNGATCSLSIATVDLSVEAEFEVERTLELSVVGNTGGSVTLPPSFNQVGDLPCTTSCSRNYLSGRTFTLVADRPLNVVFGGWTGCNSASGISCDVTMDADPKPLVASFLPPRQLSVELLGSGNAQLTISGGGNQTPCGGTPRVACPVINYPSGTSVTLSVPTLMGTSFTGWGGDCTPFGTNSVCTLNMTQNRSASANFAQRTYSVTVNFGGVAANSGVVRWVTPARADCVGPTACSQTVNEGAAVGLRPIEGPGYQFSRWIGCDRVLTDNECRLDNVTRNQAVTAEFVPLDAVQVNLTGSGTGRIRWTTPARTTCERSAPGACPVEQVVRASTVTLEAEPANADTEFVGWSGCPSPSGTRCTIPSVNGATTVSADFVALHEISIALAGDGQGEVEWTSPSFPLCVPGTCPPRKVRRGTTVTLTAQAVVGTSFTGWQGCDQVGGPGNTICTLTAVDRDRSPAASYFDDRTITVQMRGAGAAGMNFTVGGTVQASCPVSLIPYECVRTFPYTDQIVQLDEVVTSTVTTFTGWGLGCTGTNSCVVNIQTALTHARRATFN